ncbi:hypothetical protein [uncultured Pseudomonas sp.]|uniref:hypothetical protein n=1 Tax=uncultured Pseudomonas sp. TaxID=114707 RepID=UPI00258CF99C|nr:hypothetical protein [uncultured Pseudomonas sp.]
MNKESFGSPFFRLEFFCACEIERRPRSSRCAARGTLDLTGNETIKASTYKP